MATVAESNHWDYKHTELQKKGRPQEGQKTQSWGKNPSKHEEAGSTLQQQQRNLIEYTGEKITELRRNDITNQGNHHKTRKRANEMLLR